MSEVERAILEVKVLKNHIKILLEAGDCMYKRLRYYMLGDEEREAILSWEAAKRTAS